MIFIDPSETTKQSKLPEAVVRAGYTLSGLERMTGADFLISALDSPKLTKASPAPIHRIKLQKHTNSGLLVQRKDGNDLLASIPKLREIYARMSDWVDLVPPWLLVVGEFKRDRRGKVIVNGRATKWNWSSYVGALDGWQLAGGGLTSLPKTKDIMGWVDGWHNEKLARVIKSPERVVIHQPVQVTLKDDWWVFLSALPEIGPEKARRLADWLPAAWQTPAFALHYLSDLDNIHHPRPKGFGPGTFHKIHEFLRLGGHEIIVVKTKEKQT